jgi:hypothetical protein
MQPLARREIAFKKVAPPELQVVDYPTPAESPVYSIDK